MSGFPSAGPPGPPGPTGPTGPISTITSPDSTIEITGPTGPSVGVDINPAGTPEVAGLGIDVASSGAGLDFGTDTFPGPSATGLGLGTVGDGFLYIGGTSGVAFRPTGIRNSSVQVTIDDAGDFMTPGSVTVEGTGGVVGFLGIVSGETFPRSELRNDGQLLLGPGGTDPFDWRIFRSGAGAATVDDPAGGNADLVITGNLIVPNLPTADPHVVGALWNSGGIVNVSAG